MKAEAGRQGLLGEEQALAYFLKKGYRLLERRFRASGGEVDLILEQGACLVFVEVKRRPRGQKGEGLQAVTPQKQRRIVQAAGQYLLQTGGFSRPLRFDVVEVTAQGLYHVENAFSGQWPGG